MSANSLPRNFRDVGEALTLWIEPSPFPNGLLFRGGAFDSVTTLSELGNPATIVNLRRGPDPVCFSGVAYVHVPARNDVENYDTRRHTVRTWLNQALAVLVDPETRWPIYVHCTSGRDRTGVVVAAFLTLLGIPRDLIIEEFLLSDGTERSAIEAALSGFDKHPLRGFDVAALRLSLQKRV